MHERKTGTRKRKAFILATVVYEYINTAEPVGSVTLTQKYNLGVSSATIRNEIAESSRRLPSSRIRRPAASPPMPATVRSSIV